MGRFKSMFKWSKISDSIRDNGLDVLLLALTAASNAADMAQLPPLKLAAESAIQIIETVQAMKQQKGSCKDLADQSARRIVTLYETFIRIKNELSDELNLESLLRSVEALQKNLEEGRKCMEFLMAKGFVYRFLHRTSIQDKISSLLSEQKYAYETFMMTSTMRTEANTVAVRVQVEFKDPATGLLLFENSQVTPRDDERPEMVLERRDPYYADATHPRVNNGEVRPVLVLRLKPGSTEDEFRNEYKHLNKFHDPNIAHIYGIASKRSPTKFILFDNALGVTPYNQYRDRVRGQQYVQFDLNYETGYNSAWNYLKETLDGLAMELIFTQYRMVNAGGKALIFVPPPPLNDKDRNEKIMSVLRGIYSMLERRLDAVPRVTRCSKCLPHTENFYTSLVKGIRRSLGNVEPIPDLGEEFAPIVSSLRNVEELLQEAVKTVLVRSQTKPYVHKRCGYCGDDLVNSEEIDQSSGSRIEVIE